MTAGSPEETDVTGPAATSGLQGMRLTQLLEEVQERLSAVARVQSRVDSLLDAFLVVSTGLDLDSTLRRIVEAAADLVDARYGALGVLDPRGGLAAFIYVGLTPQVAAEMGHLPEGKGVLGQLINDPYPLRIPELGKHPASVGFPPHHPPMHSFLGVPLSVRGEVFGNLYMTEKREGDFTAEDETVLTALAGAAGIAIDNARLYEEGQVRQNWLTVLGDVRAALLGDVSPEEVLTLIAERVASLTEADGALIAFGPDPADGSYEVRAQSGAALGGPNASHASAELESVLQAASAAPEAVMLDLRSMSTGDAREPKSWGPAFAMPLRSRDGTDGVLIAARFANRPPFDPALAELITSLSEQTAIALDMAARQLDARKLDVYRDRDRIAHDLHDHVIQRIFAAALSLQSVAPRISDVEAQRRVHSAVTQLDDTVRDIRTAIFNLQTTDPTGTQTSLRRRVLDVVLETAGPALHPTVRMSGPVDTLVTGQLATDAEAVVREAVSNAVRHAQANNVTVTVDIGDNVVVEVVDDGIGIDGGAPRSGLRNLEGRALRLGGAFTVSAGEQGGTRIRWTVPLTPATRNQPDSPGLRSPLASPSGESAPPSR